MGFVIVIPIVEYLKTIPHDAIIAFIFRTEKDNKRRWELRDAVRNGCNGLDVNAEAGRMIFAGFFSTLDYIIEKRICCKDYHRSPDAITMLIPEECIQPDGTVVDGRIVAESLIKYVSAMLGKFGDADVLKPEILTMREFKEINRECNP